MRRRCGRRWGWRRDRAEGSAPHPISMISPSSARRSSSSAGNHACNPGLANSSRSVAKGGVRARPGQGAMVVIGLIWLGQGLGLIRGSSFMVGDPRWAAAGFVLMAGGALVSWTAARHRPRV